MGDNFYFIGYRFDCRQKKNKVFSRPDMFELSDKLEKKGLPVYFLPSKDWLVYDHSNGKYTSVLLIKNSNIPCDYRCPIDRAELWSEMHGNLEGYPARSFDVPDEFEEHKKTLLLSSMYCNLVEEFGVDNVTLRWGIFLGLG